MMLISLNILQFGATLVGSVVGTGFALWNLMSGKVDKATKDLKERLQKLEDKTDKFLDKDTLNTNFHNINDRLDRMGAERDRYITRDEYVEGQRQTLAALQAIQTSQATATATITSRIDAVLFEVGKKNEHNR